MTSDEIAGPYRRHIPALDGLRGLAILGVLGFHLFPGNVSGRVLGPILSLRVAGAAGVDLFFALSGFLITGILYDSVGDSGYFSKFYARRGLRIFPLYYGVLILLLLLTPVAGIHWHGMWWVLASYLQNTDIRGPFYEFSMGSGLSLDHFWSLAVEEQFYLLWPVVVFAVRGQRRLMTVCAGLMVLAPLLRFGLTLHGTDPNYINRSTPCRMDALLSGALLALALRGRWHDPVLRWAKGIFWGSAASWTALAGVRSMVERDHSTHLFWASTYAACRYSLVAVGSAALIAWTLGPAMTVRAFLERRTLRVFGRYSYGLYVLHFVALGFLIPTFKGWIALLTPNKAAGVGGAGLLAFGAAAVAAYLSYNLYEVRFLRLKRFFRYDRRQVEVPASK